MVRSARRSVSFLHNAFAIGCGSGARAAGLPLLCAGPALPFSAASQHGAAQGYAVALSAKVAAFATNFVVDPRRNVGRATLPAMVLSAFIYVEIRQSVRDDVGATTCRLTGPLGDGDRVRDRHRTDPGDGLLRNDQGRCRSGRLDNPDGRSRRLAMAGPNRRWRRSASISASVSAANRVGCDTAARIAPSTPPRFARHDVCPTCVPSCG
jgi:hypothetical protein